MGEGDQETPATRLSVPSVQPQPDVPPARPTRPQPGDDMSTAQVLAQVSEAGQPADTAHQRSQTRQQVVLREVRESTTE